MIKQYSNITYMTNKHNGMQSRVILIAGNLVSYDMVCDIDGVLMI